MSEREPIVFGGANEEEHAPPHVEIPAEQKETSAPAAFDRVIELWHSMDDSKKKEEHGELSDAFRVARKQWDDALGAFARDPHFDGVSEEEKKRLEKVVEARKVIESIETKKTVAGGIRVYTNEDICALNDARRTINGYFDPSLDTDHVSTAPPLSVETKKDDERPLVPRFSDEYEHETSMPPPPDSLPVLEDDAREKKKGDGGGEGTENKEAINLREEDIVHKEQERPPGFLTRAGQRLYEKFNTRARDIIRSLYENTEIHIVNRARFLYQDELRDHHRIRRRDLEMQLASTKKNIRSQREKIEEHKEHFANLRKRLSEIPIDIFEAALKERQKLERGLVDLEREEEYRKKQIEKHEEKEKGYAQKRENIVRAIHVRLDERLRPHESRVRDMQEKKATLDSEILTFERLVDRIEHKRVVHFKEMEQVLLGFERKLLTLHVGEIERALKDARRMLGQRMSERAKIDTEITAVDHKADGWRKMKEQFTFLRGTAQPEKAIQLPPAESKKESHPKEFSVHTSIEGRTPTTPQKYVAAWNEYFGSEFQVDEKHICELMKERPDAVVRVKDMENAVEILIKRARKNGEQLPRSLFRGLEQKQKSLRTYLSYEQ